ncbi:DUF5655 domain-containing protein [Labedaea rhizosphaerae]|nr:DUF5655 domain-containing protein [Labedaea rhizosphaerae]
MPWTCPDCERIFARRGQSHECSPAMPLEEYLRTGPPFERPVVEAVLDHLTSVGPVHVEPVSIGILLKCPATFGELRPMVRWEAVRFTLPAELHHPRLSRRMRTGVGRWWYGVNVREPSEVDDQLRDWLTQSYLSCI